MGFCRQYACNLVSRCFLCLNTLEERGGRKERKGKGSIGFTKERRVIDSTTFLLINTMQHDGTHTNIISYIAAILLYHTSKFSK